MSMNLKPQDIVVVLKLLVSGKESYANLARELFMSPSEVHAAVKRAAAAGLVDSSSKKVKRKALTEFLIHGLKYAFPPVYGSITRGIPTSYAVQPLADLLAGTDDLPPVWPSPEGTIRGYEVQPLYKTVVQAVQKDCKLYELLALIDAIRGGRARERALAEDELKQRIGSEGHND
jgi:DNA-binding Lrp family transcriptional regulator